MAAFQRTILRSQFRFQFFATLLLLASGAVAGDGSRVKRGTFFDSSSSDQSCQDSSSCPWTNKSERLLKQRYHWNILLGDYEGNLHVGVQNAPKVCWSLLRIVCNKIHEKMTWWYSKHASSKFTEMHHDVNQITVSNLVSNHRRGSKNNTDHVTRHLHPHTPLKV